MPEIVRRFKWTAGLPAELWVTRARLVEEFIAEHKLKPSIRRTLGMSKEMAEERMIDIDKIIDIRGGRKVPHLHFKGEIYMLEPKQWRTFSKAVMKDISKKVAAANQVSFDELLDISESASSLMR